MNYHLAAIPLIIGISHFAAAQPETASQIGSDQAKPEEIVITGVRLRMQMMAAERNAYEIFNKFNDEKRFHISCSMNRPTGTHFEKQVCTPAFQITATSEHAQTYVDEYRAFLDTWVLGIPYNLPSSTYEPMEVAIAKQQAAYKLKMKQVAEQHPEFLEAIKKYGRLREQYEKGTTDANKK